MFYFLLTSFSKKCILYIRTYVRERGMTMKKFNNKSVIENSITSTTYKTNFKGENVNISTSNCNSYTYSSVYEFAPITAYYYNNDESKDSGSTFRKAKRRKKKFNLSKVALRFAIFAVIVLVVLVSSSTILLNDTKAIAQTGDAYELYVVSSGDTLWSIAESEMPNGIDIRDAIYILEDLNNIDSSQIYTGLTLKIPTV